MNNKIFELLPDGSACSSLPPEGRRGRCGRQWFRLHDNDDDDDDDDDGRGTTTAAQSQLEMAVPWLSYFLDRIHHRGRKT